MYSIHVSMSQLNGVLYIKEVFIIVISLLKILVASILLVH